MTDSLTLFHYWRSSCSWRVRWVLALKGLDYESIPVNLLKAEHRSDDYLAHNPSGLVPTLKVNDRYLSESLAIIDWLDEAYPQAPLLPRDPWQRALTKELSYMIACGIQPIQNLKVANFYSEEMHKKAAWNRHFIEEGFRAVEKKLAAYKGPFATGSELSLVDIVLVPQVYNALRVNVEMRQFPRIEAVYNHCLKSDACDRAAPHRQPGAQP